MPNIATALKSEISRVARREIKTETTALKLASTRYRSEIALLKRQLLDLKKEFASLSKSLARRNLPAGNAQQVQHRYSARSLAAQRKRLRLSLDDLGKLIGVSGISVLNWESGKAKPREQYLPAIFALKRLARTDAIAVLSTR